MILNTNGLFAGHFLEPDSYFMKRPHGRDDWLLMFTLEGAGFVNYHGVQQICKKGALILLTPGTPHDYGTMKNHTWQFVWVHFPSTLTETNLLPQEGQLFVNIENESIQERIHLAFARILADSRERGEYWFELCCSSLREIILMMAQKSLRKIDPRIEEVLRLLSQQMREEIRLDSLAQTVGLSPSRLSHLFKASTGYSIIDTLNRMRIQQAVMMLADTGRSASEVCYDVGFQNYNHFTNQFRKWQGMTPSMFMKNLRQ
ncbi:helix-turn-helix domain-containing protein [Paenibacillus qinlingensis]|uniref:AraC family transcriptional regulator of arabinose operon n=1 Tax=Paenibacillus qinlingensis TaxID=1837343 RepID=A0ABU1NVZ3_9BACL|nr:helix-turn-helix domain-containing protein [Paenibacillus qinlingensis]MDR6551637.1 AraC family transcriptional regulator of arabinose operon [Paenibacillus qinlingensis]